MPNPVVLPAPEPVLVPAPVAQPPPAPATGKLTLTTTEPCNAMVDGALVGGTPLTIPLPIGKHEVWVRHEASGFEQALTAFIAANETTTLRVNVPKAPAPAPQPSPVAMPAPVPEQRVIRAWHAEGDMDWVQFSFEAPTRAELNSQCRRWKDANIRIQGFLDRLEVKGAKTWKDSAGRPMTLNTAHACDLVANAASPVY